MGKTKLKKREIRKEGEKEAFACHLRDSPFLPAICLNSCWAKSTDSKETQKVNSPSMPLRGRWPYFNDYFYLNTGNLWLQALAPSADPFIISLGGTVGGGVSTAQPFWGVSLLSAFLLRPAPFLFESRFISAGTWLWRPIRGAFGLGESSGDS